MQIYLFIYLKIHSLFRLNNKKFTKDSTKNIEKIKKNKNKNLIIKNLKNK